MTVPTPLLSIAAPEKRSELMSCLKFGSSLADSQTDDDQAKKQTDDDQAKSLSQVCLKFVSSLADSQTDDDQAKNLTNRNLRHLISTGNDGSQKWCACRRRWIQNLRAR